MNRAGGLPANLEFRMADREAKFPFGLRWCRRAKLSATCAQLTVFHHASMYSARRF
jgi:hypothetical protein